MWSLASLHTMKRGEDAEDEEEKRWEWVVTVTVAVVKERAVHFSFVVLSLCCFCLTSKSNSNVVGEFEWRKSLPYLFSSSIPFHRIVVARTFFFLFRFRFNTLLSPEPSLTRIWLFFHFWSLRKNEKWIAHTKITKEKRRLWLTFRLTRGFLFFRILISFVWRLHYARDTLMFVLQKD